MNNILSPLGFVRVGKREFVGFHPKSDEKLYTEWINSTWKPNVLTNDARDKIHIMVYINTEPLQRGFGCIGLTETALTPDATDTSLSGEITNEQGLDRAEAGTKTHTTGTNTSLIEHTFTATAAFNSPGIRGAGLFDQLSGGILGHVNTFTTVTLAQFDQLRISWIITAGQ